MYVLSAPVMPSPGSMHERFLEHCRAFFVKVNAEVEASGQLPADAPHVGNFVVRVDERSDSLPVLRKRLADAERLFDPNYMFSDSHQVWSEGLSREFVVDNIRRAIAELEAMQ